MEAKYIKQEISTEICEEGGATARLVGNKVLPLGTAVEEAISGSYAIGDKTLLTAEMMGLVKSMVENCAKDGNAREIDGLFSVTPKYYGLIDPETGHNPAVNGVELNIRLLKELKVDTSKWTFKDVTPGKEPIKAQTVSTGAKTGEVVPGATSVIKVTGYGLENTEGVDWAVPENMQSGTFAANKVTKSANVVTITDGLASLNVPANDGKKIVLNVRGAKNSSKVTGTLKYAAPTQKPLKFYPTAQAALDPTSGEEMSEVDRSKTTLYLNAAGATLNNGDVLNAKLVPTGGGDPLTTTVTVVKGETTMNAAAIDLPFCEPAYTDVYGMMTFENAAVKGDIEMVAM